MSNFEFLAEIFAGRALNAVPAGFVIAILAWMVLRLCGTQRSSIRFAVWLVALTSISLLPLAPRMGFSGGISYAISRAKLTLPSSWAMMILAGWILISMMAILRLAIGLWRVHRIRKNSLPVETGTLPETLRQVVAEHACGRPIAICISSDVHVPTAIGFFRPAILLPAWIMNELSAEDLRTILLHEFAHLRRRDDWTNLAQKIVRALFFFHPAVWWIERRLSLEREIACDELVLEQTCNPLAYAECLVSLAEKGFFRRGLAMAQAAISRARDLSVRLSRILSGTPVLAGNASKVLLAASVAGALILTSVLAGLPEWISFGSAAPVPVIFRAMSTKAISAPVVARTDSSTVMKSPQRARRKPAQVVVAAQKQTHSPLLVRAAMRTSSQPAGQFLLFMRTTRYDAFGDVDISFTVWRITTTEGRNRISGAEVIARSL